MKKNILLTAAALLTTLAGAAQWQPAGDRIGTEWGEKLDPQNVLPEYPRPQMTRTQVQDGWQNLNGLWNYAILPMGETPEKYDGQILVPFAVESSLSGVGKRLGDRNELWYNRTFTISPKWNGKRVLLHFGAVDWKADVWVNGVSVGSHTGGYTPFEFDITEFVRGGENELLVRVRTGDIYNSARGKQSYKKQSFGCFYTRVTGIWQPVWLEFAPKNRIRDFYFRPDLANSRVNVELLTYGKGNYRIRAYYDGREVGSAAGEVAYKTALTLDLSETHLWREGEGNLYDVTIEYEGDEVRSYFGLRGTRYDGMEYTLNGKPIFQRFVMDQGYYPGGVYTPRDPVEFAEDIERGKALGFNGVRLHQKLSDPRLLYLCDKVG